MLRKNSRVGRILKAWEEDVIRDLGGRDQLSTQQLQLIQMAVHTKLLIDTADAWLFKQPTLIDEERRQFFPVIIQRQRLVESLAKMLETLGLARRTKELDVDVIDRLLIAEKTKEQAKRVEGPQDAETTQDQTTGSEKTTESEGEHEG